MEADNAILLVNLGTPGSPGTRDVGKYLREFLGDKRIITLPWLFRKLLVNLVIVPFRASKSARLYQAIWTNEGSPLLVNSNKLKIALACKMGENYDVFLAMRYGSPALKTTLTEIAGKNYKQVTLVPLFPQYAESTTGSVIACFNKLARQLNYSAKIKIIKSFFNDAGFIESFRQKIEEAQPSAHEHFIFSFHGLPVNQTVKMHPGLTCEEAGCMASFTHVNAHCYRASCYETSRLLAESLKLRPEKYTVCFQSRFGKNWLQPFTDEVIKERAAQGIKKILIVSPSFVADCLETVHELGILSKQFFLDAGGSELHLVESLNADPAWVKSLSEIILNQS